MKNSTDIKNIVVLTGAGISAESGLKTFRDSGGLWEGHRVEDVATPQAWHRNPETVLRFYNERRQALIKAAPNEAHRALVELETLFNVSIITQNVDDLHERAGSTGVLHLHGELMKSQSTGDSSLIYETHGKDIQIGDKCERGSQLRPFIVWFGEAVPMMDRAITITRKADIFLIVGTSLNVYPAATLTEYTPDKCETYLIDPAPALQSGKNTGINILSENATTGVRRVVQQLTSCFAPLGNQ
jgi:NAD-dependent deacetylase